MAYEPEGTSVPSRYGAAGPPRAASSALRRPLRLQPNANRAQGGHPVIDALLGAAQAHEAQQAARNNFKQALAHAIEQLQQHQAAQAQAQAAQQAQDSLIGQLTGRPSVSPAAAGVLGSALGAATPQLPAPLRAPAAARPLGGAGIRAARPRPRPNFGREAGSLASRINY